MRHGLGGPSSHTAVLGPGGRAIDTTEASVQAASARWARVVVGADAFLLGTMASVTSTPHGRRLTRRVHVDHHLPSFSAWTACAAAAGQVNYWKMRTELDPRCSTSLGIFPAGPTYVVEGDGRAGKISMLHCCCAAQLPQGGQLHRSHCSGCELKGIMASHASRQIANLFCPKKYRCD